MVQTLNFEDKRVLKRIKMPRLKEICPDEKCYYSDGTYYIIFDNAGNAHPNVAEIDGVMSYERHKPMVKCYLRSEDSLKIIENILFPNIDKREIFAQLVLELSELHNTKNKKIGEVEIEYERIEKIYDKYKKLLVNPSDLYIFCYYWITLCIALDYRKIENKKTEDKSTVIGRSLIVKDAVAVIRQQIKREDFGKSWPEVVARVEPGETITSIDYKPVKGYEKRLNANRFVNKKGKKISVEPCVKLTINTDEETKEP